MPAGRSLRHPRPLLARVGAVVVLAGVASAVYQAVADRRDRRRFAPPGRLVDIGGRRIHLLEAGEGSPAVVILPALGGCVLGWVPVWRALSASTRACVYDRAGIGWSDPPPAGSRAFDDMAGELHLALDAAGIRPPYLLVGHSLGGSSPAGSRSVTQVTSPGWYWLIPVMKIKSGASGHKRA